MLNYSTWMPYAGSDAVSLAIVLAVIGIFIGYFGTELREPIKTYNHYNRASFLLMLAVWALSIATILVNGIVYGATVLQQNPSFVRPPSPGVAPFTILFGIVTFGTVFYLTRKSGVRAAFLNGILAGFTALAIFEVPYSVIVFSHSFPALSPSPTLYRLLLFLPFFVFELATFALMTSLPSVRISRQTMFALAAMFFSLAAWAVAGFGPPTSAAPYALNVLSKLLAFVTSVTLFLADRRKSG